MKLIFCPACADLVSLRYQTRACGCGRSWGRYLDVVQAEIGGEAVPVGVAGPGFEAAVRAGQGGFPAFVIPETSETVRREW